MLSLVCFTESKKEIQWMNYPQISFHLLRFPCSTFTANKHFRLAGMGQEEVRRSTALGRKWLSQEHHYPHQPFHFLWPWWIRHDGNNTEET